MHPPTQRAPDLQNERRITCATAQRGVMRAHLPAATEMQAGQRSEIVPDPNYRVSDQLPAGELQNQPDQQPQPQNDPDTVDQLLAQPEPPGVPDLFQPPAAAITHSASRVTNSIRRLQQPFLQRPVTAVQSAAAATAAGGSVRRARSPIVFQLPPRGGALEGARLAGSVPSNAETVRPRAWSSPVPPSGARLFTSTPAVASAAAGPRMAPGSAGEVDPPSNQAGALPSQNLAAPETLAAQVLSPGDSDLQQEVLPVGGNTTVQAQEDCQLGALPPLQPGFTWYQAPSGRWTMVPVEMLPGLLGLVPPTPVHFFPPPGMLPAPPRERFPELKLKVELPKYAGAEPWEDYIPRLENAFTTARVPEDNRVQFMWQALEGKAAAFFGKCLKSKKRKIEELEW